MSQQKMIVQTKRSFGKRKCKYEHRDLFANILFLFQKEKLLGIFLDNSISH